MRSGRKLLAVRPHGVKDKRVRGLRISSATDLKKKKHLYFQYCWKTSVNLC